LLVLTQHAQEATEVSYYHRTAKDWVESRLDEIATDAGDGFDPNLALLEWQASQVQNTDIPEVLGLKENQLQSVGYFLWVWIARCFFHCPRLIDEPKNYASIVQTLDRIEEKARQVITRLQEQDHPLWSKPGGKASSWPSWWASFRSRHSSHDSNIGIGFLVLAARLGAVIYVRLKVASDLSLLTTASPEGDILQALFMGPYMGLMARKEYQKINPRSHWGHMTRQLQTNYRWFEEPPRNNENGPPSRLQSERYQELVKIVQHAMSEPIPRKERAQIKSRLTQISIWLSNHFLGYHRPVIMAETLDTGSGKREETSYPGAVLELLMSYGIGPTSVSKHGWRGSLVFGKLETARAENSVKVFFATWKGIPC